VKKVKYIPVEKIKPLEKVFPHHYENLKKMIYKDGFIKYALVVEKEHNIVLDGSNRHLFLALEGYKYAPVHYVDYNNPHIRVGSLRMHSIHIDLRPVEITKEEVIERGINGDLFPPRTTRHFMPFLRPELNIQLKKLGKRNPIDLTKNIADVSIQEEIENNKKYILEIEEEITEMIHYMEESIRTKKYLLNQIKEMKKCQKK